MLVQSISALLVFATLNLRAEPILSDPYLHLEEVEGEQSLQFVREQNDKSVKRLQSNKEYSQIYSEIKQLFNAKDRVPDVFFIGSKLYNLWKDGEHPRGLLRRTTLDSYKTDHPLWETVLDFDQLSKDENKSWNYGGINCLEPLLEKCLVSLSNGGKDAEYVREFNLKLKEFVKDGFSLPEAKHHLSWADENTIMVGSDFGEGSLSDSGYPIWIKELKRGQKIEDAPIVFKAQKEDVSAYASSLKIDEKQYRTYYRSINFSEEEFYIERNGHRTLVDLPRDVTFKGNIDERMYFYNERETVIKGQKIKPGTLLEAQFEDLFQSNLLDRLKVVLSPDGFSIESMSFLKDAIAVAYMENVSTKIMLLYPEKNNYRIQKVNLGKTGVASIDSVRYESNDFFIEYTDFLSPRTYYYYQGDLAQLDLVKKSKDRFDASLFQVDQFFSASKDGTKIPYFVVHAKDIKYDGNNPTLLYGYGGFNVSMTPGYSGLLGKVWLERGGVYVLSNIRGGNEFGPEWHDAVIKKDRMKVYEDFISIAEDLIARKITSPRHLGIQGGSNGGLLVGATMILRPDLFNAVYCQVPLLDMLRFHKLLAGASWMNEYGNPDDPEMRQVILTYSPYQNIKKGVNYPEAFVVTSTKDDRVHPAHARKFVARMKEFGHDILYFEDEEGGHTGGSNVDNDVRNYSLGYTYLFEKLF